MENDEVSLLSPDAPLLKVQSRVNICWDRGSEVSCWQAQLADEMPLYRLSRVDFTLSIHCPPIEGIEGVEVDLLDINDSKWRLRASITNYKSQVA